jgi:uncharacterized protein (TIGR03118 family)
MGAISRAGRITTPATIAAILAVLFLSSCSTKQYDKNMPLAPAGQTLNKLGASGGLQVNLVANSADYSPMRVDPVLQNAWGIAVTPNGKIWISANHSGRSVVYNLDGSQVRPPVKIPTTGADSGGAPTGQVFNPTSVFVIPTTQQTSRFIFAGEDGIISAWASGNSAIVVSDRSVFGTVYKGLAMAQNNGANFLYATDFRGNKVDVFDDHFVLQPQSGFSDPTIPAGFAPFNIQNLGGKLFVTYAMQKGPDNMDDQSGPGFGFVDIYNPDGTFVRRFASHGTLNSPWGLAWVPGRRSEGEQARILVGNFGDGRISMFRTDGHFVGQVSNSQGKPVTIDGLWALAYIDTSTTQFLGRNENSQGTRKVFFTAGPNDETDGVFGYLQVSLQDEGDNDQGDSGSEDSQH